MTEEIGKTLWRRTQVDQVRAERWILRRMMEEEAELKTWRNSVLCQLNIIREELEEVAVLWEGSFPPPRHVWKTKEKWERMETR